jgi:flavin-dependent dehydrogenase
MTRLDALVVGAGPAGSVAAIMLAGAGMRVRLLDRARFPRPKLCGDTLNPGALALLAHLDQRGFAHELSQRIRARALPLHGMTVSGPGGSVVTADYPDDLRGVAIGRGELDALLLESAAVAGADIREGVRAVTPIVERGRICGIDVQGRSNESWRAAHVIIADGRGSRLAASLQLSQLALAPRRWAFGAYFSGVSGVGSHGEMHLRRNGYIGVAPLPGGLTNVCVVRPLAHLATHRIDRRAVILEAVRSDRWLAPRFDAARQESELRILGPLAVHGRAAGCPGAVLAGDVAGFVDPMTGDGLRFAIGGAMLAADAVLAEAMTGRAAYALLASARRRAFAGKYRFNRALRLLAGSPRALAAAAWLSDRWPLPAELIIRTAGDVQHAQPASPLDLSTMRLQSRAG